MGYRKVDGVFWTDPKVRSLTEQERYLFLYCITCPSAHSSGLYYNPMPMISYETGINDKALSKAFGSLREGLMVYSGSLSGVIFVRNMLKFQAPNKNEKESIAKHLKTIQDKELLIMFLDTYTEYWEGFDKASLRVGEGFGKDTDTNTKTDTKTNTDIEPSAKVDGFAIFEDAWDKYPKDCRRTAVTEFEWLKKQHKDWKSILPLLKPAMENYSAIIKNKQKADPTTKVKHMQGWLTERRWEMYKPQPKSESKPKELRFVDLEKDYPDIS